VRKRQVFAQRVTFGITYDQALGGGFSVSQHKIVWCHSLQCLKATFRLALTDSIVTKASKTQFVLFNNFYMLKDGIILSGVECTLTECTLQWFTLFTSHHSPCVKGCSVTVMLFFKFGWRCKCFSLKHSDLCRNSVS